MENYLENTSIISFLWKWKKPIITITIIGAIISAAVSLLIPPMYKSTAVVYPANIEPFSAETKTEQMMQMLQSSYIADKIIDQYDLYNHYDIDKEQNHHYTTIIRKFKSNVNFTKTEFESVQIDVFDQNADTACNITKSILDLYNDKTLRLNREKSIEWMNLYKSEMDKKKVEMDSLENELNTLREKYGLLDYKAQVKEVTKRSLRATKPAEKQRLDTLLKNLRVKGGQLVSINEHLWRIRGVYNDLKENYEIHVRNVEQEVTYTNIVDAPMPADKKSTPVRWMIVLFSTISAFIFSILAITFIENIKKIKLS